MPLQRQNTISVAQPKLRVSALEVLSNDQIEELGPKKNYKRAGIAALAALLVTGGYFAMQSHSASSAKVATAPAAAAAAAPAPSPAPKAEPSNAPTAAATAAPTATTPPASTAPVQGGLRAAARHAPPPAAARTASAPHRHAGDGDEPDVGY